MDFALFLVLNAVLFIRPGDFIPDLQRAPIYYVVIILTLLASILSVGRQLTVHSLASRPITVCVLAMIPAVMLSHLTHGLIGFALTAGIDLAQVVLYYLLFVGIVNTPDRLRTFLKWLLVYILVLAGLALVQYHGLASIPALAALEQRDFDRETGDEIVILRLKSTGVFNDPNDLSLILSVGTLIAMWLWGERQSLARRLACLAAGGVLVYAITLTQSRGGLLALMAGLLALVYARFGWRKAALLGVVALPAMVLLFVGRQTSFDINDRSDTAQARIQLWSSGLVEFRNAPIFGIGMGQYEEEVGQVAHNSYVHAFTELGLFGGTWFAGAFYLAISGLNRLGKYQVHYPDPEHGRLRPFLLGIVVSYAMGLYSLSRNYVIPTYLILGLATAYLDMVPTAAPILPRFGGPLVRRLLLVSAAVFAYHYLFVRLFAVRS